MPVEKILKLVSDYGLAIVISAFFISFSVAAARLLFIYFKGKIEEKQNVCPRAGVDCPGRALSDQELDALIELRADMKRPKDLMSHQLFGTIRALRVTTIPSLMIKDVGRRMVFTDLLSIKFSSVASAWDAWLQKHNQALVDNRLDGQFLMNESLILVADIVSDYELKCRSQGIPEAAIVSFAKWHSDAVYILCDDIQEIATSDWIVDSTQRVGLIMSAFMHTLEKALRDCELAQHKLNGTLTGQTYKGVICGPVDDTGKMRLLRDVDGTISAVQQILHEHKNRRSETSGAHPALTEVLKKRGQKNG